LVAMTFMGIIRPTINRAITQPPRTILLPPGE
jgi:hypothetical protein